MLVINGMRSVRPADVPLGNVVACTRPGTGEFVYAIRVEIPEGRQGLLYVMEPTSQVQRWVPMFGMDNGRCLDLGAKAVVQWAPDLRSLAKSTLPGQHGDLLLQGERPLIAGHIPGGFASDIHYWDIANGEFVAQPDLFEAVVIRKWTLGVSTPKGDFHTLLDVGI